MKSVPDGRNCSGSGNEIREERRGTEINEVEEVSESEIDEELEEVSGSEVDEDPEEHSEEEITGEASKVTTGSCKLQKKVSDVVPSNSRGTVDSPKKCRQSRWDDKPEGETPNPDGKTKRRKTRWDNNDVQCSSSNPPGSVDFLQPSKDPKVNRLKLELMEINKKLQSSKVYDESCAGERSPSPEPVSNSLGIRINTRDARIRKKLTNEKNRVLSELANAYMTLKSLPLPKPKKLKKKLFVPVKEYPTYNFVGLILGPNGNTLKKMEKETGARIFLRGKGVSLNPGHEKNEEEDLHIQVEAPSQLSLEAAVGMVEKLLIPVAEEDNHHKKAQLSELAKLRGIFKVDNICYLCKERGHKKYDCPRQASTFKATCCDICGSFSHSTSICGNDRSSVGFKDKEEVDPAKLYVGFLPLYIDDNQLKEMFQVFGRITSTAVIKDQSSGVSKGYGFVQFENPSDASSAIIYMNGYKMEGNNLSVRIAGEAAPVNVPIHPSQTTPQPIASSQTTYGYQPLVSMLPEAPFSIGVANPSSNNSGHNYDINAGRSKYLNAPPTATVSGSNLDFCDKIPSSSSARSGYLNAPPNVMVSGSNYGFCEKIPRSSPARANHPNAPPNTMVSSSNYGFREKIPSPSSARSEYLNTPPNAMVSSSNYGFCEKIPSSSSARSEYLSAPPNATTSGSNYGFCEKIPSSSSARSEYLNTPPPNAMVSSSNYGFREKIPSSSSARSEYLNAPPNAMVSSSNYGFTEKIPSSSSARSEYLNAPPKAMVSSSNYGFTEKIPSSSSARSEYPNAPPNAMVSSSNYGFTEKIPSSSSARSEYLNAPPNAMVSSSNYGFTEKIPSSSSARSEYLSTPPNAMVSSSNYGFCEKIHSSSSRSEYLNAPPNAKVSCSNYGFSEKIHSSSSARSECLNAPPNATVSSSNFGFCDKIPSSSSARSEYLNALPNAMVSSSKYDFCDKISSSLPYSVSQFSGHPTRDYPSSDHRSHYTSPMTKETQRQMPGTERKHGYSFTSFP